jgi:hypothetical protein
MNYEIIKYRMVMLTEREKIDVADADMIVGWMLYAVADCY